MAALRAYFAGFSPSRPDGAIEHRAAGADGGIRWLQWSDRAFFDEEGAVEEFQSVGRDVTGRKEGGGGARRAHGRARTARRGADDRAADRERGSRGADGRAPCREPRPGVVLAPGLARPPLAPSRNRRVPRHPDGPVRAESRGTRSPASDRRGTGYRADRFLEGLLSLNRLSQKPLHLEARGHGGARPGRDRRSRPRIGRETGRADRGTAPGVPGRSRAAAARPLNLVGNAVKFTRSRDPARIAVLATTCDGTTVYQVRDNGVGFPPAVRQRSSTTSPASTAPTSSRGRGSASPSSAGSSSGTAGGAGLRARSTVGRPSRSPSGRRRC